MILLINWNIAISRLSVLDYNYNIKCWLYQWKFIAHFSYDRFDLMK